MESNFNRMNHPLLLPWPKLVRGCLLILFLMTPAARTAATPVTVEGTVNFLRPAGGGLELAIASGTNQFLVEVTHADGNVPALFDRVRVTADVTANGTRVLVDRLDQVQVLTGINLPLAQDVASLRRMGAAGQHQGCLAHLEGLVLAVSPGGKAFAFQDGTGVALFETGSPGALVTPGQRIILEDNFMVEGNRVLMWSPPVVDDNDVHSMLEKSGAAWLSAGRHPLRLAWFNREYPYGLEVYYSGPDRPRQRIADNALFRRETNSASGAVKWVNGLNYGCYEGNWLRVPDYGRLIPAKHGTAANFNTEVVTRIDYVGLQFTGWLEVPRDGIYTFSLVSDDGSLLFIDEQPPAISVTGTNAPPEPAGIAVRQALGGGQDDTWAQVEGTVTFAGEQSGGLELELSSDDARMRVEVADDTGSSPQLLLNSRVQVTGICLATRTADGQNTAGLLLTPGMNQIQVQEVSPELWSEHPLQAISNLMTMKVTADAEVLVHVRGKIRSGPDGTWLMDDSGSVRLATAQPPPDSRTVEALGRWTRVNGGVMLQPVVFRGHERNGAAAMPFLTTIEQIKRLNRDEWQRGYPVKIRGVITTVLDSGFFIQDSTRSIYARWQAPTDNDVPRVGEFWEIEGNIFAEFAPNIRVTHATRLGAGTLPEPLHPTWDQLINGSLDTEYVEVQGIITAVDPGEVTLLMRAGKVRLLLPDRQTQELRHYENALVRIRGCVIPVRDTKTQQVVPGQMNLSNVSIAMDEPPPENPFTLPLKHISDLRRFDSRAGALQRVKIAGQIIHERDGQFFLMDGSDGLRVVPKSMKGLNVGDLVEVVGFPELGGPSPVLHEAIVHGIGAARLPDPAVLPANAPLDPRYDATLVRVRARLVSFSRDPSDQVLELQSGTRGFVARLRLADGLLPSILPGSLLELTGIYSGHGTDLASGRGIDSFELLLNSPPAVTVLEQPSWWTVRRALAILGAMACVIFLGLVWIALLRRQVEERSSQLAAEVRRHEHTERQRELEEERTRIARDLHDDLGATLTQIRFLSALESRDAQLPESTRHRMSQVTEKSREMVASLDEIVWAVNPANDSLPILANYLCHFAEEFFRPTPIRCRLDVDDALPSAPLTAEVRHNLYLAVRESLNNIAKHSQATEVWLRIRFQPPGELHVTLEDNGRGFAPDSVPAGNGLANMRRRLENIQGRFDYEAKPGAGVVCRFKLKVSG